MDTKLNVNQQCACAVKKANSMLGHIRQIIASSSKKVTILLVSALVRPYLECCVQFWASQYQKDMDILEKVQ